MQGSTPSQLSFILYLHDNVKAKKGGTEKDIEQKASCTHATKGAVFHAKLLVMTQDY